MSMLSPSLLLPGWCCCLFLQDWSLDSVSQTAQLTTAVVSRALDTCDTNDIQIYNDTDQVGTTMQQKSLQA
jgi:hypothetical protein